MPVARIINAVGERKDLGYIGSVSVTACLSTIRLGKEVVALQVDDVSPDVAWLTASDVVS